MATYFKPDPLAPNRVVHKIDSSEIHYVGPDGLYRVLPVPTTTFYGVPADGNVITPPTGINDITLAPATNLAALTFVLPASPRDGDTITFSITRAVTALTVNGNGLTVNNVPTALTAGQTVTWKYLGTPNQWFRKV